MTEFIDATEPTTVDTPPHTTILLHGAHGKMGRRIHHCAQHDARITQCLPWLRNDPDPVPASFDDTRATLVDFTSDHGALRAIIAADRLNIAVVVGSTGLSPHTLAYAQDAAQRIPVLLAPNTAHGAVLLQKLVDHVAETLRGNARVHIAEAHHKHKQDAPSGTAKLLCTTVRNHGFDHCNDHDVRVIRAGNTVGRHTVRFQFGDETIELHHACLHRDTFARNAIDAACWLHQQPPQLYHIHDLPTPQRTPHTPDTTDHRTRLTPPDVP